MGEVLWDMLPEGKKIGGAPANFAYHVSQFGLQSCVVSAVGDDKLGHEILDNFHQKGLEVIIPEVPFPTGTVQVEIDPKGVAQYDIKENVAWDNIPFTPELEALARNTVAVCFGSLAQRSIVSRTTINRFLDAMPQGEEQLVVFDINLRQNFYTQEIIENSLKRCNILKINDEELVTLSRMLGHPGIDFQDICRILLEKYNLKMLILTCGINGSYVFTPDHVSFQPTPKVEVFDTVGAGDSFTGSFIASLLQGKSVEEAHRTAVAVSAYVCTQPGAMPPLNNAQYKRLWMETFGDPEEFVEDAFSIGEPVTICEGGRLVSALLLIPYSIGMDTKEVKAFYIYGVATDPEYRQHGKATMLLEKAHERARKEGAEYCFLVAADDHLRRYYMNLGYSDIVTPGESPEILHSAADMRLVKKYQDPWVQEPVQMFSLNGLPLPPQIKAQGLLSH